MNNCVRFAQGLLCVKLSPLCPGVHYVKMSPVSDVSYVCFRCGVLWSIYCGEAVCLPFAMEAVSLIACNTVTDHKISDVKCWCQFNKTECCMHMYADKVEENRLNKSARCLTLHIQESVLENTMDRWRKS